MIYLNYPSLTTGSAPVLRDGFRDSCCKQIIDQKTGAQNRKYTGGRGQSANFGGSGGGGGGLEKKNFPLKIWHHELLQLSYRYIVLVAWKGNTISTMLSKFSHCTMLSNKRTSITLISMHITGGLLSHLFASLCLYLVMNI